MQGALSKVAGVTEVISVTPAKNQAVVKVEKGQVDNAALVAAVEADPRFKASVVMPKAATEKVTLKVTGMTCEACPAKVEAALGKVDGVTEVISVSTDSNTALVKVVKDKVTADDLTTAVKTAGFTAEVVMPKVKEVTLKVTGMMCEACPAKVEAALGKVDGVTEVVSVSFADKTAVVKVEKGKVTADALIEAIAGAHPGFNAEIAK